MFELIVNGKSQKVEASPGTPLLYILRNDLELNGPKFGCGLDQCGACSVLIDGEPARSCSVPVEAAEGRSITTLEGIGNAEAPHPVQQAFIDEQALQCGYCTNGMIVASVALLKKTTNPTEQEIRVALDGYLCRCGSHTRIIAAVKRAAQEMAG